MRFANVNLKTRFISGVFVLHLKHSSIRIAEIQSIIGFCAEGVSVLDANVEQPLQRRLRGLYTN